MSIVRRRIIVPRGRSTSTRDALQVKKRQRLQARLARAMAGLERWQRRLRRACSAVVKHQTKVARINQQLQKLTP